MSSLREKLLSTVAIAFATAAIAGFTGLATAASNATVVGAGPGAGAYQMAGAMAENVNRQKIGVTITNRASKGFVANTDRKSVV